MGQAAALPRAPRLVVLQGTLLVSPLQQPPQCHPRLPAELAQGPTDVGCLPVSSAHFSYLFSLE